MNNNSTHKRNNNRGKHNGKERRYNQKVEHNKTTSDTEQLEKDAAGKGHNDASWYALDNRLLLDSASMPYGWPTGAPLAISKENGGLTGSSKLYIPGVMSIKLAPTIGAAQDAASPVNMAAIQMYSDIRHVNSGSANYEAGDLMLYFLAMSSVYSYINFLQRAYGVATMYSQNNRYLPFTLLRSMNIDGTSLQNNLANFRAGVNLLIAKAAAFAVPSTMSLFHRQAFLYRDVYCEGDTVKDQMYLYNPAGFYFLKEANQLEFIKFDAVECGFFEKETMRQFEWDQLLEYGREMIDRIITDEDMGTMNGDILKCYGNNILKLTQLPETYPLIPVRNNEVLEQMQNATIMEDIDYTSLNVISAYDGGEAKASILRSTPKTVNKLTSPTSWTNKATDAAIQKMRLEKLENGRVLVTASAEPSPQTTMINSRLMSFCIYDAGDKASHITCGTEIAVECKVYTQPVYAKHRTTPEETIGAKYLHTIYPDFEYFTDEVEPKDLAKTKEMAHIVLDRVRSLHIARLQATAFKYAPIAYTYEVSPYTFTGVFSVEPTAIIGNISNFTVLQPRDIEKLHLAAIMSEFTMPAIALIRQ